MATSRPRDLDRETYSAIKTAQQSSQLPSSLNPFKTAFAGPTWFMKTIDFTHDAFKVDNIKAVVEVLDLASVDSSGLARNDVLIYDAFMDVTAAWVTGAGGAGTSLKITFGDADDPDGILVNTTNLISHATGVDCHQAADKGAFIAPGGSAFDTKKVLDKPVLSATFTGNNGKVGDGTATFWTAGSLKLYFKIATPVSLDADGGIGTLT